jgi:hypothetical protein
MTAALRYIQSYPGVDVSQPYSVQYFVDLIDDKQWAEGQLRLYECATLAQAYNVFGKHLCPDGPKDAAREALDKARATIHTNPRKIIADLRAIQSMLPEAPEMQLKEVLLYRLPADLSRATIDFANQFQALHRTPPTFAILADTVDSLARGLERQRAHLGGSSRGSIHSLAYDSDDGDGQLPAQMADAYDEQFFAIGGSGGRTTYPCLICLERRGIREYHRYLACENAFCLFCGAAHPWFRCPEMLAAKIKHGIPTKPPRDQQPPPQQQQRQQQGPPRPQQQQQQRRQVN